jgi:hypothetical protein
MNSRTVALIGILCGVSIGIAAFGTWQLWPTGNAPQGPPAQIGIWVGAIGGSVIGIIGGVIGAYFSIKNTLGPRERAFMIRGAIICAILVTAFLVALWLIPGWYRHLLWIPYAVVLPMGIRYMNRRQAQIRREEEAEGTT